MGQSSLILGTADPLIISGAAAALIGGPLTAWAAVRRAKPGAQLDVVKAMEVLVEQHRKDAITAQVELESANERAERAEARAHRAEERIGNLEDRIDDLERKLQNRPNAA